MLGRVEPLPGRVVGLDPGPLERRPQLADRRALRRGPTPHVPETSSLAWLAPAPVSDRFRLRIDPGRAQSALQVVERRQAARGRGLPCRAAPPPGLREPRAYGSSRSRRGPAGRVSRYSSRSRRTSASRASRSASTAAADSSSEPPRAPALGPIVRRFSRLLRSVRRVGAPRRSPRGSTSARHLRPPRRRPPPPTRPRLRRSRRRRRRAAQRPAARPPPGRSARRPCGRRPGGRRSSP